MVGTFVLCHTQLAGAGSLFVFSIHLQLVVSSSNHVLPFLVGGHYKF